jgi:hypothetical protein
MPVSSVRTTIELVFDERQRAETVAALRRRLDDGTTTGDPVGPAADAVAVPEPLAALLPRRGLPRGGVVSVVAASDGGGATSLLLSLLAAPSGAWIAVVGMPGLGLAAAAELGIDLDRLVVIPDPGPDVLQILSVLTDGIDLIVTVPPSNLPPARQRVFAGRLRQRGAVLLVAGRWPGADVVLTVRSARWTGLDDGHGRLRDRELDVAVDGRRMGGMRSTTLALRASRAAITVDAGTPAVDQPSLGQAVGQQAVGQSTIDLSAIRRPVARRPAAA